MSFRQKYRVRFTRYLVGIGDYDICEFAIVREPDVEEIWRVEFARSLQTELANLGLAVVAIAARAIGSVSSSGVNSLCFSLPSAPPS